MDRVTPVSVETAEGKASQLLDAVKAKLGTVPNMTRAMAVSPPVLEAYLGFSDALAHGVLPARVREQLALVLDSRKGTSTDPKTDALLRFARTVVTKQGIVDDADVEAVKAADYGDAEIAEAVAHVALNVFTNYFNKVAGTAIDFPRAPALSA